MDDDFDYATEFATLDYARLKADGLVVVVAVRPRLATMRVRSFQQPPSGPLRKGKP